MQLTHYFAFSMIPVTRQHLSLDRWRGLHDGHTVAYAALVVLIMRLQADGALNDLLIQGMTDIVGDGNHNGLTILSLTTMPVRVFLKFRSLTLNSSFRYACALISRSRMMVLTIAISLRMAFRRIGFSSWLIACWNRRWKKLLLEILQLLGQLHVVELPDLI